MALGQTLKPNRRRSRTDLDELVMDSDSGDSILDEHSDEEEEPIMRGVLRREDDDITGDKENNNSDYVEKEEERFNGDDEEESNDDGDDEEEEIDDTGTRQLQSMYLTSLFTPQGRFRQKVPNIKKCQKTQ